MEHIDFKKLINQEGVMPLVLNFIRAIGSPVLIEDSGGNLLIRSEDFEPSGQHPVKTHGMTIGWVHGDERTAPIASMLSYIADRELDQKMLAHETLSRYREISLLYDISGKILLRFEPEKVAEIAIEKLKGLIRSDNISIMLMNEKTGKLEILSAYGRENKPKTVITPGKGIGGSVFANGKAEIVNGVLADPRYIMGANKTSSMMCAPLVVTDRSIGIINMSTEDPFEYFSGDLKLFQAVASQTAAAIQIARLHDDQKSTFYNTVCTLAETIEKRDHITGKHTKRVMEYSKAMGAVLGLSPEELAQLELSAALHDIGNIGLKDSVLLRQGRITEEEFEEIKRHPLYAEEILGHIAQLKDIIPGVKYHHERFDGKGYPEGLRAEQIPISARIITVADCYDTITTDRPYRKAMDIDAAFEELRKGMGTQFDPEVVEAFFSIDVVTAYFTANSKKKIIS